MLTTFKKLAQIYAQIGNPTTATTYYDKTQVYLNKAREEAVASGASKEDMKELIEQQSHTYFEQYLLANAQEDTAKSIDYINKQTACQIEIYGDKSQQVCSNLFLTAQFQLKSGRYTDA